MQLPKAGQMFYVFMSRRVHVIRSKRFKDRAECECYANGKIQKMTVYADGTYINHSDTMDSFLVDAWEWTQKGIRRRTMFRWSTTVIRSTFRSSNPAFDNLPKDPNARKYVLPILPTLNLKLPTWMPSSLEQMAGRIKRVETGRVSAAEPQPCCQPRGVVSNLQLCKVWPDGDTSKEPEIRRLHLSPKLMAAIDKMAEKEIPISVQTHVGKEYVYVGTDA